MAVSSHSCIWFILHFLVIVQMLTSAVPCLVSVAIDLVLADRLLF